MTRPPALRIFVATVVMSLSNPAHADFVPFSGIAQQTAMNTLHASILENAMDDSPAPTARSYQRNFTANQAAASVIDKKQLIFSPSIAARKKNLSLFIEKTKKNDPVGAKEMERIFSSTDIIASIGTIMKSLGLNPNSVADAYAVYWVAAWQAANLDTSEKTGTTYRAVALQAARGIAAEPTFMRSSNGQKQEMAEALLVQAALIDSAKDVMSGDDKQTRALASAVRQGARASGLDLDAMTLTEDGFVPAKRKKGSSLGDDLAPTPGRDGDTELAAANTNTPAATADPANPPYLLMAAAGGAGIAGVFMLGKIFGKRG